MTEIKDTCYKGTRILLGNEKRNITNKMTELLISIGFQEIQIPIIQFQETFEGKVGEENNNMMFIFQDRKGRDICLAPEYTAVVQKLAKTRFKHERDLRVFYVQECFRGESPQKGRYRQFTQLGVEILNPSQPFKYNLITLAQSLLENIGINDYLITENTKRGLDYYDNGQGFEFTLERLGSSKQILGGGSYPGGIGFAIGIDRILEAI